MSQSGWVKPDFGGELSRSSSSTRKQSSLSETLKRASTGSLSEKLEPDSFSPVCSSELVVQKKKVAEVKQWLELAYSSGNQAQFLLLTGPPGCGKHQTLSVLCNESNISILCWEEPIKHFSTGEWENEHTFSMQDRNIDINYFDHLEEFFERSYRYGTLCITNSKRVVQGQPSMTRKLLLLKEFPPMIFKNLDRWHNLLQKYSLKGRIPAVFILTDGYSYNNSRMKLFPPKLQEKLMISTVSFSGVANTFLLKALQKASLKQKKSLPLEVLQEIVESCNGDLRSALNSMQWMADSNPRKNKSLVSKKRKLANETKKKPESTYVKDASLDFMHAIGKVLHSKRLDTAQQTSVMPTHLLNEQRLPLKDNIEELTEKICETPSKVLLYLHQNYPLFFNRIEDVSKAIEHLSSADLFSNRMDQKETLEQCALLTGVRGLMHSNTSVNGSTWRPLRKPDYYAVNEKQQTLCIQVKELWPNHTRALFFSEILPFVCHIQSGSKWSSFGNKPSCLNGSTSKSNQHGIDRSELSFESFINVESLDCMPKFNNLNSTVNTRSLPNEDEEIIIEDFDD